MKHEKTVKAKLIGGPEHGRVVEVPKGTEVFHIGRPAFWTYTFAGREDGFVLLAIRPKQRVKRRFIVYYVTAHGQHPIVVDMSRRPKPVQGRTQKYGRGRARRQAA